MLRAIAAFALLVAVMMTPRFALADEGLTLAQAIALGLKTAPSLRAAKATVAAEDAQVELARSPYYPSLSATVAGQATGVHGLQPNAPPKTGVFSYVLYTGAAQGQLNAQWTMYDFGRTRNSVANQEAQRGSASSTVAATEITVAGDVSTAYVTLVYAEKLRDVARATVVEREKLIVLAKALIKSGLQPPVEEIRASARAAAARRALATAEAAALDARAVLAVLIGQGPNATFRVSAPRFSGIDVSLENATKSADAHPTVVAARRTVDSKNAIAAGAESLYLPVLGLNVSAGYTVTRYDTQNENLAQNNGVATITLTGPIYDPSISPTIDSARSIAANADGLYDQAKRDAREEAERAAVAVRAGEAVVTSARKAAEDAAVVLTVVSARYAQGLSSAIELIDAETSDNDARVGATQAEFAQALAVIRLQVATGRPIEDRS